ncbi:2,6-dioxo-6-phenylhexa-3-enoate hydrolase [Pigmentiphaga litoralis]|uniref:alpha/beta fold hydrolase n=1 Tax=Pigmentiphaga litoralis TaxID=516702 RepID=UPI0019A5E420|nr:alpha/beta hydrolase [Pigmentiphaga litoralis]GGX19194.1 2,6-dioxo-6-phenylhexa-3-enoate hydrolase [Pigmentiphaga litoralis]
MSDVNPGKPVNGDRLQRDIMERTLIHGAVSTRYLEAGEGPVLLLIHGSGPGVSARANWQGTLASELAKRYRVIAPDVLGFGATAAPADIEFSHDARVSHVIDFMTAMGIESFAMIGNSMGGAIALSVAHRVPHRVTRMVLMGAVGTRFPITDALDRVWGYEASIASMRELMDLFAYDKGIVNEDLIRMRYEASLAPGILERYHAAFAAPRQRHVDAMALSDDALASITTPTLLIHGAQDRIIPLEATSLHMARTLPNADLVVLGRCGHWTQIERGAEFRRQVASFLDAPSTDL